MREEDFIRAADMLRLSEPATPEAAREMDERVHAMLMVVATVMRRRVGGGQTFRLMVEALRNVEARNGVPFPSDAGADAITAYAGLLVRSLRERDAEVPEAALVGHNEAAAMILAGSTFLQERHGIAHLVGFLTGLAEDLQALLGSDRHILPPPDIAGPVRPPPPGVQPFSTPRTGTTLASRVAVMGDFLRGASETEAHADALATIAASTAFLRERFGERYAADVLRQAEDGATKGTVSDGLPGAEPAPVGEIRPAKTATVH